MDLNWIHAGLVPTPEKSQFASACYRIHGRWQEVKDEMGSCVTPPAEDQADAWLAPVYLDERAAAYVGPDTKYAVSEGAEQWPVCNPIGAARISNKGFLPMTRDQYLSLVDALGRVIREGKRGFIAADVPPILERLKIEPQSWHNSILDLLRGNMPKRPTQRWRSLCLCLVCCLVCRHIAA